MKKSIIFSLSALVIIFSVFMFIFGGAKIVPSVEAADQPINDSQVVISSVKAVESSWLVIQTETNGIPGPVIGYAKINKGENKNVVVKIDKAKSSPKLFAMIHVDDGVKGKLDFPGGDTPLMYKGEMVTQLFSVK